MVHQSARDGCRRLNRLHPRDRPRRGSFWPVLPLDYAFLHYPSAEVP